ncbi:MAG TPA: ChaN family lipoprotein [Candidatus Sulfotelmatobacter sp.]|nr:ChaN family lipoprotein [Candidatus Sulfotelmatobacter sp.]
MASTENLRSRRSAAQLHALAGVEREIRALDSHSRRKYLREFTRAFRTYEEVLSADQVRSEIQGADVILVGDYHALPAAQRYAASLIEQRALAGDRPVVLGVETIFARDQHIVDEWWRREIEEAELRERVRFDLDWGYDWAPFREVLVTARDHAEGLYGLDCMPREDLRKIGARDRHAAAKVAEIREKHPNAVIVVLFGESHLAPGHLPKAVREALPGSKVLTVLQNIDALYWRAAGERADKVEAVRVGEGVLCVFNATPLEKYESYRLCLDQWSRCDKDRDFAPTIYNLIDSLASFLEINRYSPHNGTQPKFLIDMLPEVVGEGSDASLGRLLGRRGVKAAELEKMLTSVTERGCTYLPGVNAFWIRDFQMAHAAEDVARFLHHACQGLPGRMDRASVEGSLDGVDVFYARVIETAVVEFGARVLHPARETVDSGELPALSRAACEKAALAAARAEQPKPESAARQWGRLIGSRVYDAYLAGKITPRGLRRLFLAHLDEPGLARKVCHAVITKLRSFSKPLVQAAHAGN